MYRIEHGEEVEIDHDLEKDLEFKTMVEEWRRTIVKVILEKCGDRGSECWGPIIWSILHGTAQAVPCPVCSAEAQDFITFFHDWVNKQRGKPLYAPVTFEKVKRQICKT